MPSTKGRSDSRKSTCFWSPEVFHPLILLQKQSNERASFVQRKMGNELPDEVNSHEYLAALLQKLYRLLNENPADS